MPEPSSHPPTTAVPATTTAPAKLTLSLRITGTRADGYHLIDAEMVSLDLDDTLTITPLTDSGTASCLDIRFEPPASQQAGLHVDAGEENLVSKALRLLGRAAHVEVVKRIPVGAGLGGGSADAAAILRWGAMLDPLVAASLGADVAFCLRNGRARVTGIGERLEPLTFEEERFTLLIPPFGCSTAGVYRMWDRLGGPAGDHGNDLETAALAVEPRLAEFRDRLGDSTGQRPRLAGSGSTWFVPGAHPGDGRIVVTTTRSTRSP